MVTCPKNPRTDWEWAYFRLQCHFKRGSREFASLQMLRLRGGYSRQQHNIILFDWFRFNRFNEHCTLEASEFVRLITTIAVIMLLTPHSCCRPNFRMLVCASVWVD